MKNFDTKYFIKKLAVVSIGIVILAVLGFKLFEKYTAKSGENAKNSAENLMNQTIEIIDKNNK